MDTDFVFLALLPLALSVGLFYSAKVSKVRIAAVTLAAAAALLLINVGIANSLSPDARSLTGVAAFVVLPIALVVVGWLLAMASKRAWLALVLCPVGYFLGFVLGVNVWLWFGYPI